MLTDNIYKNPSKSIEDTSTVIVVTNDQGTRKHLEEALGSHHQLTFVNDFTETPRPIDGVIIDTPDCFEMTKQLRAMNLDCPIVVIFPYEQENELVHCVHASGATDYLTHPLQANITRERTQRLLEQNKQQQAEIERLKSRNRELDAYAHMVAHDLKNPVATMVGSASLVQQYHDRMSMDDVLEQVDFIVESGLRVKNIINALLMFASVEKNDQLDIVELDMGQIVEKARQRLGVVIEEREAQIIMPARWPRASGYGPWVEEVWANYLSNALKYGGEPPRIELGAEPMDDKVRFWIRDNGQGIPVERQKQIFLPFERLNTQNSEGHGLGLSVVRRIVTRLGGEVGVESHENQGSVFSFTLPTFDPYQK